MQKVITEFISADVLSHGRREVDNNWKLKSKSALIEHVDLDPYFNEGYRIDQTIVTAVGDTILAVTFILEKT